MSSKFRNILFNTSFREVMLVMSVTNTFCWGDVPFEKLNALSTKEKQAFLEKEEMNIRQSLGEAVPTIIFRQIAKKIRKVLSQKEYSEQEITALIQKKLAESGNLFKSIKDDKITNFAELAKIEELANAQRYNNSAYFTQQDICFSIIKNVPDAKNYMTLNILEPSISVGNFLPILISKYKNVPNVTIDVVDIDKNSIELLNELLKKIGIPYNIKINYIHADFLLYSFDKCYDMLWAIRPI